MTLADHVVQTTRHPEPATLAEMLALLGEQHARGIVFISGTSQEELVSYARLLADARRMLGRLRACGLEPGQEVVIQTGHNRALLTIFWACVLGGLIPVPLAAARQPDNRRKLWGVWTRLTRPWLAVDAEHWDHLAQHDQQEVVAIAGRVVMVEDLWSALEQTSPVLDLAASRAEELALVQFSSGSTGMPKGVSLTHANLLSNLRGMTKAAEMTAADSFFGWMPLTHDMGLIAFHLWPTFLGVDQFILETPLFIRRPGLWLAKASEHRATVLGSPNFGYQLLLASLRPGQMPAWDLRSVRVLFTAAEPISALVCDQFLQAMAPLGLDRRVMYTVYGLAESAVGAAFPLPGREYLRVHLDRKALSLGDQPRQLPPEHPDAATFAVEGWPLIGTEIAILDAQGRQLAPGRVGRVALRGPSVTAGYYGDPEATAQAMTAGGWLDTGDLGLMQGGRLIVTGRLKDVIFSRGQNFFSHDLERVAEATPGLGPGKALVVGLSDPVRQVEEVIVFLRHRSRELAGFADLANAVAENIARSLGLAVDHVLPLEVIPKTTSGKLRRYLLRQRYLAGEFAALAQTLAALRAARHENSRAEADSVAVAIAPELATLWAEVLERSAPPAEASFFALGGDSLRAIRLVGRVREELGLPVTMADLLEHSSLTAFAACLARLGRDPAEPGLTPAPAQTHYPATSNQRRLYALQAASPDSIAYNLPLALRVAGELDTIALQQALAGLVALHEPLRTGLEIMDGQTIQRVHAKAVVELARAPWPAGARLDDPEELGQVLRPLLRPFDLARPPLLRATLLGLGPTEHLLLLDLHHAIADGGSLPRLLADLGELYTGREPSRPQLHFKDHAVWLAGRPRDEAASLGFWRAHLGPETPRLDLPLSEARPPWPDHAGQTLFHDLDPELNAGLERLAAKLGVTPNLLLMAGFGILLGRHADQEDLVLATVAEGREQPGCRDIVGMFVNTLPLRVRPEAGLTLTGFLAELRAGLAGVLRHQDQPLEDIPAHLGLKRQPGREPLFDVMFAPEELGLTGLHWPGLALELMDFNPGVAKFDLTLFARRTAGGRRLWLEYASAIFSREAMLALLRRYETLLRGMVGGGGQVLLRDLEVLPPEERRRLLVEFNATTALPPEVATLPALISRTAAAYPEAVALEEAGGARGQMSYREMECSSNRLARRLRGLGLAPGGVAAILSPRGIPLMLGILASLKAGAAFLPLEPTQPSPRLSRILADSGARLLLLGPGQAPPPDPPPGLVHLRLEDLLAAPGDDSPLASMCAPDDLAYIIYTSGSTGQPKGVMIEHRAALNYLCWAVRTYLDGQPGDFPLFTSVAFDLTITTLFAPLISGGRVLIYGEADAADLVGRVVAEDRVKVIKLTPAHLAILREGCPRPRRLKALIVGGEDLKSELAGDIWRRLGGGVAIYNEYGPTETTVGCMIHRFDPERDRRSSVPIGRPAANTALYVLDRQRRPLPEGAVGELYIAGAGLARGYWQRPELTSQSFPENPFAPGQRMYASGDLVRFLPSGVLEYLGRGDQQIKLHGMRIELGEIEARLKEHPGVADAVVVLREYAAGGPRLVGYYTSPGAVPTPAALLTWLAQSLPRAMLPSALVALASLPLTPNGKLDREALPEPVLPAGPAHHPPRDEREAALCAVFSQALGREAVGVEDNFFDLGGDSIKAVQIASRLVGRGWRTTAGDILRQQTIAALAPGLVSMAPSTAAAGDAGGPWGELPMTAWLFAQGLAKPGHYHQSLLLEARRPLAAERLASALTALVSHHPGLRLNRDALSGRLQVNPAPDGGDFGLLRLTAPESKSQASLLAEFKAGWDLTSEPLFRAAFLESPSAPPRLLLCAHHMLVDLVSWTVILEDLAEAYVSLEQGRAFWLPPAGLSPALWVEALRRHYETPAGLAELPHWRAALAKEFRLPRASEPASWRMADCASFVRELEPEASALLPMRAREVYGADSSVLVLAALSGALAQWCGCPELVIECEGYGRSLDALAGAPDLARGLGWYTAMYPLALRLAGDDPAAWVEEVKARQAQTPQRGVGFGVLRHLLGRTELAAAARLPAVRFNYLGEVDRLLGNELFRYSPGETGPDIAPENRMTCELEVVAMIVAGRLRLRLTHHAQAQTPESIRSLAEAVCVNLRRLLDAPAPLASRRACPEDFDAAGLSVADLNELFKP